MSTIINAECVDQELIITNSPVIASGGIHENFVAFKFCSKWDGLGKTAVFYRNEKEQYCSVLDANNVCEIPHEVTDTEGTFYFGVFGVSDDTTKTSKVLKYKVTQGSKTESLNSSSEPTPDIYQQILSAYGTTNDAIEKEVSERKASILAEETARKQADSTEKAERQAEIAVERARINALTKMEPGSTMGDAELQDIRIGADGVTYETAGASVRAQVTNIKSDLSNLDSDLNNKIAISKMGTRNLFPEGCKIVTGGIAQSTGADNSTTSSCRTNEYIPLENIPEERFITWSFSGGITSTSSEIYFYDENKTFISRKYYSASNPIPSGTKYIRFCWRNTSADTVYNVQIEYGKINTEYVEPKVISAKKVYMENEKTVEEAINTIEDNDNSINKAYKEQAEYAIKDMADGTFKFAFVSDTHGNARRIGDTVSILNYFQRKFADAPIFHGGDIIWGEDIPKINGMFASQLSIEKSKFASIQNMYFAKGNHEAHKFTLEDGTTSYLTDEQFYQLCQLTHYMPNGYSNIGIRGNGEHIGCFWLDYSDYKIRVIVLNEFESEKDGEYNGQTTAYTQEQVEWLYNALLGVDNKAEQWGVIVITHYMSASDNSTNYVQSELGMLNLFVSHGTWTSGNGAKTYDFTSTLQNAHLIAVIGGHTHADYYGHPTSDNALFSDKVIGVATGGDIGTGFAVDYFCVDTTNKKLIEYRVGTTLRNNVLKNEFSY